MQVVFIDLPEKQAACLKKNCKIEPVESKSLEEAFLGYKDGRQSAELGEPDRCSEVLIISGNEEIIAKAVSWGLATIAYQTPEERKAFQGTDMIVEGFEEVEDRFLQRVYERHQGIPWKILETERLIVRELALGDLEALFELYSYEGMTDYMEGLYSYEEELEYQKAYITHMYGFCGYGMWLVFEKETGRLVGRAGLEHREALDGELELGYAIGTPYWNRGYGTEVCQGILKYAKEELGFSQICSLIQPENVVSLHLAEKLGFALEREVCLEGTCYKKYGKSL